MNKLIVIICLSFLLTPLTHAKPKKQTQLSVADKTYNTAVRLRNWVNEKDRFNLYAKSAQLGHAVAQFNLAMMYVNGKSVNIDHQQAVYWYKKSAAQNFSSAQHRLGEMYYFAKGGLKKDVDKAINLFRLAAAQNEVGAQLNLAILYGSGEDVPLNFSQANFWFGKALEQSKEEVTAYQNLLFMAKDKKLSKKQSNFYWTEKAAELSIPGAKAELARLYKEGLNVIIEN